MNFKIGDKVRIKKSVEKTLYGFPKKHLNDFHKYFEIVFIESENVIRIYINEEFSFWGLHPKEVELMPKYSQVEFEI